MFGELYGRRPFQTERFFRCLLLFIFTLDNIGTHLQFFVGKNFQDGEFLHYLGTSSQAPGVSNGETRNFACDQLNP
jgi:hypothetical protein